MRTLASYAGNFALGLAIGAVITWSTMGFLNLFGVPIC